MKTTYLRLLMAMFVLLSSLLVVACEEDSDDGETTDGDEDGDEESIDCLSLTEEQCAAHAEECRTYLAIRYSLKEDGCLYYVNRSSAQEFASCGAIPPGCEDIEIDVLSPNNEFWFFSSYCIPEGWVNMTENEDICETRDCPTEPFCWEQ